MASHSVAEQTRRALEVHLVDGSWPVGTRLPAERVLAETLGVSRNSVREAIFCLKERGLLFSRHGSGVFVSDRLQTAISSPWRQLVAAHPDLRWDTLEFRRELEGATAYYAALRANASDLEKIEGIVRRLTKAYDTGKRRRSTGPTPTSTRPSPKPRTTACFSTCTQASCACCASTSVSI